MGGGGSYYDRDTDDGYAKTPAGYSPQAEKLMSLSRVDPGMLPKGRKIVSRAKSPVAYAYDVTGSVDNLPLIIVDKMPLIAGQIIENGYLEDPEFSLAAVGDVTEDTAPLQVGDFSKIKDLDDWLKRIWREKRGGSNDVEGYEHMAYYYARYCEMPNAVTPFFLFTGDEGLRNTLYKSDLERHFGGTHETISCVEVFKELDRKFKGNVFLIHRYYKGGDEKALSGWRECLGDDRIIPLREDLAIADITLGLFAVVTGARTLDTYLDDMRTTRDKAQSKERISQVKKALTRVAAFAKTRPMPKPGKRTKTAASASAKDPAGAADTKATDKPAKGKKRGRV